VLKREKRAKNLVGHPVNNSRNGMEEKRINDIGIMRRSQLTKATYKLHHQGYREGGGAFGGAGALLFQGQAGPAPEFIKGNEPEYTRLP